MAVFIVLTKDFSSAVCSTLIVTKTEQVNSTQFYGFSCLSYCLHH